MFVLAMSFISCSKDDGDGTILGTKNFRAKEIRWNDIYGSSTYEGKSVLSYTGEKLSEVIDYDKENGVWLENYKYDISYQGDWVYFKEYYREVNSWVEESYSSFRIKIIDGKFLEEEYTYSGEIDRYIYTYSGNKLVSIENFYNGELGWKDELIYNGDQIQEYRGYSSNNGVLEFEEKSEFTYSDGKLTQVIDYYNNNAVWVKQVKYVYLYSGNQVIQIDAYDWNNSWEPDGSEYFSYNSDGLLESISEEYGDGSWEEHYTYEAGRGNLKLLQSDGEWNDKFNYPTLQKPIKNTKAKSMPYNKSIKGKIPLNRLFR